MRNINIAVAQMGPISRSLAIEDAVSRLISLLEKASRGRSDFVVFPELALTTFFPRWYITDDNELDQYYQSQMPDKKTLPLFNRAKELGIGFYLGYAEIVHEQGKKRRFNTSILVDTKANIIGKYRKVHLPGHAEYESWRPFQHLEKRYFEPGDKGFNVWKMLGGRFGMCLCNDRRWPETWRVMGLKGVELVALGYNTPTHYPPVPQHDHLQSFHHLIPMQAAAYQNGTWIAAAAKAGVEEGCMLLGHSCIIAPTGEIVAMSSTLEDELIFANCDLDRCQEIKDHIFNFKKHRQPHHYGIISDPALHDSG